VICSLHIPLKRGQEYCRNEAEKIGIPQDLFILTCQDPKSADYNTAVLWSVNTIEVPCALG
jgi:hypothetical protein